MNGFSMFASNLGRVRARILLIVASRGAGIVMALSRRRGFRADRGGALSIRRLFVTRSPLAERIAALKANAGP